MSAPSTRGFEPERGHSFSAWSGLGIATSVLIAAIVLLFILLPAPSPTPGPGVSESPIPSATAAAATVDPTRTPATTTSPIPSPTSPSPSPAPTSSSIAAWAGLTWSEPVTPAFTINLRDLVPWEDGYVAVGQVAAGDAAFLISPDGVHWTVRHRAVPSLDRVPRHLVALDGELLAFSEPAHSVPLVWRSVDGTGWSLVESPAWAEIWADHLFIDVASGPNGLVAIGSGVTGEHDELLTDPVVLHSRDGLAWQRTALEGASELSVVRDVIGLADGYAILGGDEVGPVTGMGTPRAWWSDDGLTWRPATLAGATADDNQFESDSAVAGVGGLVARTQLLCAGCPPTNKAWVSSDGRTWQRAADLDAEPPYGMVAGDGTRLVVLSTREGWAPIGPEPEPYPGLTRAWVSTDGLGWQSMSLSHPMTDQVEAWWVVPDGIVFAGVESFWFGTASNP